MKKIKRPEILYEVFSKRAKAVEVLSDVVQGRSTSTALAEASSSMHFVAKTLGESYAALRYEQFASLLDCLTHYIRWKEAIRSAEVEADRHARAAKQLAREVVRSLAKDSESVTILQAAEQIQAVSDVSDIESTAEVLLRIPLPLPLFVVENEERRPRPTSACQPEERVITVAFISFWLNNIVFGHPHTVQPNTLHELSVEVRISRWPDNAEELILDVITVEQKDKFQLPQFKFQRPYGHAPFVLKGIGRLFLEIPQDISSRPLEFAYRAKFVSEDQETHVEVEGQRHLLLQSFDPVLNPISGYQLVDQQLVNIRNEARSQSGIRDKELADFLLVLTVLGKSAGAALQDNLFPGKFSEKQFQSKMREKMRSEPRIGSELEEHPKASGGITDLSFRRMRIELKVEQKRLISMEDAKQYLGQTSQYAAGSDTRFGILCMLDCSPKTNAPGSVANDISVISVKPPTNQGLPILVGVVIIRGNLPRPSSLSVRRKENRVK